MPLDAPTSDADLAQAVQQLSTYLYQLGENQPALEERIQRLEGAVEGVTGVGGVKAITQQGDVLQVDYEDGRTAFLQVALDLPEREEVFYPWTFGLVYDNRNEFSAVTSGGGAWTIHKGANRNVRIANEDPIPWDEVTLLTVSARDGTGVNRRKMFESATFDNGELVIALRRETGREKGDFLQVGFQLTGDVIDNEDTTYSFPVTRSVLAQSYDQGQGELIRPPLGGDYDLLLLLPDLPDIRDFPSGRLAGWYWVDVEADVATLLERLGERDPWPQAAIDAAEAGTPGDNVPGDIVTLVRGDVSSTRGWDGARLAWVVPGTIFDGNLFVHGTINTDALAALAVTAPKIFLGNGLIAGNADRLTLQIANNGGIALTANGISVLVDGNGLRVGPNGVQLVGADNSITIDSNGIAFNINGGNGGLTLGPNGVGIDVAGNSLLVGPTGIYLNRAGGGGVFLGPDGIGVSVNESTGLSVGPNGVSLRYKTNSGLVADSTGVAVGINSVGGLQVNSSGIGLRLRSGGGLTINSSGVSIDLAGSSLGINANGIYLNYAAGGGITLGPAGIAILLGSGSGLLVGPTGISLDLDGNSLEINALGLSLNRAAGGGITLGAAGVGIDVDGNSISVGPSGISLKTRFGGGLSINSLGVAIAVAGNGLRLTSTGIDLRLASGSGLSVGPTGISLNVSRFGGLTIGALGIGLLTAAGGGLTVGSAGISLRTPFNSGLTVNSAGISLDLQGNSGLFINSSGVALRTAPGRRLQITSAGLGIDVDGSSLKLGASGISLNPATGGGLRLTSAGVEIRAKTGGGIIVDSTGVSFDGSSVPRVWTRLSTRSQTISATPDSPVTYSLNSGANAFSYDLLALFIADATDPVAGGTTIRNFGFVEPSSAFQTTAIAATAGSGFQHDVSIAVNAGGGSLRCHRGNLDNVVIKEVWGINN